MEPMDWIAKGLTPILNVSDIEESFAWFERLGWKKSWDWGDPPDFGGVTCGECQIFGHAVGRARDARAPPRWSRIPHQSWHRKTLRVNPDRESPKVNQDCTICVS